MKTINHNAPNKPHIINSVERTTKDPREEIQALRIKRQQALTRLKAIEKSHWYGIKALPEQREKHLREAQESFHNINKKITQLSLWQYPLGPKEKKTRFFKEGGTLYRLAMSERHRDKYHLAVLSPNLTYESPIPMSLEEFGHHHPEAKKLENQEAKEEIQRLLESLKLFMGYYAL